MTLPDRLAFDQEVSLFLATCRTAAIATVDDDGAPHAANVQYAHDEDFRLYWVSSPGSVHSENVTRNARAAVTVYAHDDRAENIHGLQLRGTVSTVTDERDGDAPHPDWQRVWELYTAKFAFVASSPQLKAAVERQRFYCFTPAWLRWIDNRVHFGFKVEKALGHGTPAGVWVEPD